MGMGAGEKVHKRRPGQCYPANRGCGRLAPIGVNLTPMGMGVRAEATLTGIKGKMLTFDVNAFDDKEKIGQGTHQRAVISAEPFLAQCLAKGK